MDNLEKFNSTKLNASEMKEIQGGGWLDDLVNVVKDVVAPIVKAVGG